MPDPTQLKADLEAWREQSGAQSPLPLMLAESLLSRAEKEREAVAQKLYQRIEACLEQRCPVASVSNEEAPSATPSPLAPLLEALKRETQAPQPKPLSKLDQQLQEQNRKLLGELAVAPQSEESTEVTTGLRAASRFQQHQIKHAKHRKVRIALEQKPENPGPLNPHMLAVKILNEIQAVSPAYLDRFVSYIDALNALQQSREHKNRKAARGKGQRK